MSVTPAPVRTYFVLAAGLAMFAFAPIFVRGAGPDADPVAITTIRTVTAFLILVPFWAWARFTEYRNKGMVSATKSAVAGSHTQADSYAQDGGLSQTSSLGQAGSQRPDSSHGQDSSYAPNSSHSQTDSHNQTIVLSSAARIFSRAEVGWSALAGFFLAAHFMLWIGSLFFTSVASASVLVTIHPIMLIIVESVWLKKKFPIASWIGVLIALGGSIVLGVTDSAPSEQYANPLLGNAMALSAAFMFVFYILISQKIRKTSGWLDYVFPVFGFTALGSIIISMVLGVAWWSQPMPTVWSGLALAVGASVIGHGSMNYAVKFITATLLSTLILSEPVFATILAYFIFNEIPATGSIIAMLIIMGGVLITWWSRRRAVAA